jgi:endonuclease/exonuclease/phosphatase family metal-dependent hydrolase
MGVPDTLRVLQLNIGSLLEPGWDERRHEIAAWLDRIEPDVVCFQEVWESPSSPNTAGWVADAASGTWHLAFGGGAFAPEVWPDPDLRFGSAVLSRWPIDDQQVHLLPAADDDPAVTGVPWELLWVSTAGLDLFSTHLAPAPAWSHHRCAQVVAIDGHIRTIRGEKDALPHGGKVRPSMPPILCGDFNAEPESDEIRFLTGFTQLDGRTTFFQDAWRVAGDGPGLTQDWQENGIAASMNVHRKRIDYVLVGDPFLREGRGGRVLAAQRCCDEPMTGVLASDHFGVVVDISWPNRPAVGG